MWTVAVEALAALKYAVLLFENILLILELNKGISQWSSK